MAVSLHRIIRSQSQILWTAARHGALLNPDVPFNGEQPTRGFPTAKHYEMKWRLLRWKKVKKMDLPVFVELKSEKEKKNKTFDEMRMEMKKEGRLPPRTHQYLPLNISSTVSIIDAYKPPEGDGKQSFLSTSTITDVSSRMLKSTKSLKHQRILKKYEDFVPAEFAQDTLKIVTEAQMLLRDVYKNQDRLHELVTEKAFPEMVHGLEHKTLIWQMVETVEPPKVVQIRTEEMITAENLFGQVTVRLHTKQILAIYDRFGRLMYGDPLLPKSVVEYVVMEKWISDTYGRWRVHGKIIPDWMSPREVLIKTYRVPTFEPMPPEDEVEPEKKDKKKEEDDDDEEEEVVQDKIGQRKDSPQVALA